MAKKEIRQDDLDRLRYRAAEDVIRELFKLANELVRPFLHRYGVGLWDPDTLQATLEGEAVLTALIYLPEDVDDLPEPLVEVAMHRIIDETVSELKPPTKAPELSSPTDILMPLNIDLPEGIQPDAMLKRLRVPPYTEQARASWTSRVRPEASGCWRWVGKYVNPNRTTPMFCWQGDQFNARRAGLWLSHLTYTHRRTLPTVCKRSDCVNPDHVRKEEDQ